MRLVDVLYRQQLPRSTLLICAPQTPQTRSLKRSRLCCWSQRCTSPCPLLLLSLPPVPAHPAATTLQAPMATGHRRDPRRAPALHPPQCNPTLLRLAQPHLCWQRMGLHPRGCISRVAGTHGSNNACWLLSRANICALHPQLSH